MRIAAQATLLVAAGVLAGATRNALAPPERRLDWVARRIPAPPAPVAAAPRALPPPPLPALETPSPAPIAAAAPPRPRARRPPRPAPEIRAADAFAPHPDRPWVEITPEQAKALFDRGAAFLDARRSEAYREGHISGALSMPVWEADLDEKLLAFSQAGHDPTAPLVVYCTGGDCEDSHMLAQRLWSIGFNAVFVYKDGFPDWERRGWSVRSGEAP